MATALQTKANRENASKSTGPRTAAGKRASSLNALRHGLTAQIVVLPSEDMEAYRVFTANFVQDLAPEGILETQLAQTLADTQWRLNRFRSLEASLFALGHEQNAPKLDLGDHPEAHSIQTSLAAAQSFQDNLEAIRILGLHEQRLHRAFQLTLRQLRETQALRQQQPAPAPRKQPAFLPHPPKLASFPQPPVQPPALVVMARSNPRKTQKT